MKLPVMLALLAVLGFSPVSGGNSFKNISVKQAHNLIREHEGKGGLVILDVRTSKEFADGHISGAINIDFWSKGFVDSVTKLDRRTPYLIYCTSGVRSGGAMKKMRRMGFVKMYNMKGGLFGWRAARLPLTNDPRSSVIPAKAGTPSR